MNSAAPKTINITQNTEDWLKFRSKRIGASEAPAVMGVSPWMTPYELWMEKTGRMRKQKEADSNWAIERGNRVEPLARAKYELIHGVSMEPAVFVHPEYDFISASLDGWNETLKRVLEIKVPGKEVFNKAKAGEVDERYLWQLEQQLFVTGGVEAHFYCVKVEMKNGVEKIVDDALVIYKSVPERREKLVQELLKFWDLVTRDVPPPLTDKDALALEDIKARDIFRRLGEVARARDAAYDKAEKLDEQFKELKTQAAEFSNHPRVVCEGVELVRRTVRGRIDYSKIPQISGVDIEQYRGKEIVYYDVNLVS